MKNIKNLGEKEVILCTTLEECEAIARLLDNKGFTWWHGAKYMSQQDWKTYNIDGFCFYPKEGTFDELFYFKDCDYIIHNAKDFLKESIKQLHNEVKQELQDILNEWEKGKFQIPLSKIIRERLK